METKQALRAYFHTSIKAECVYTDDAVRTMIDQIMISIWSTPKTILAYFPMQREPPLLEFFCSLHEQWWTVCMPVEEAWPPHIAVRDGTQTPVQRWLQDGERYEWIIDVAIVPWVLFTSDWARLGHWWGWYDRVLARYSGLFVIGVGHRKQCVSVLPQEDHDRLIDEIVITTSNSTN